MRAQHVRNEWPPTVEVDYSCLAYNGDLAEIRPTYFSGATPPAAPDMNALGVQATRNTSRAIAFAVLPIIP
jgi:hypothetical protein